jgi:hypothetical protein
MTRIHGDARQREPEGQGFEGNLPGEGSGVVVEVAGEPLPFR